MYLRFVIWECLIYLVKGGDVKKREREKKGKKIMGSFLNVIIYFLRSPSLA